MAWYYVAFATASIGTAIWLDVTTTDILNFLKGYYKRGEIHWFGPTICVVTILLWTWFLYLSNIRQKPTQGRSPQYTKWYEGRQAPKNGQLLWVVFSGGDTALVRWLTHREVFDTKGELLNFGPGWAVLSYKEQYPIGMPVSWQYP